MTNLLLIAIGGAAGSVLRYGTSVALLRAFERTHWPWGTFAANAIGCLLAGYVNGLLESRLIRPEWRFLLTIGFLGGYTTFSTFGYETVAYLRAGQYARAAAYVMVSNVAAIALVFVGFALARLQRA